MDKKMLCLRAAYWAGIIADAVVVILLLFPKFYVRFNRLDLTPDAAFALALRRAAPLMAGWTILLFWANRKPVERKDILLMTICPVVVGYIANLIYATRSGFASFGQMVSGVLLESVFVALFTAGYVSARQIERQGDC